MTMIHELKILEPYYEAMRHFGKNFTVRLNDRGFQKGDTVIFRKPDEPYSPLIAKKITYVLQGGAFGIDPRYCVLGLEEPVRHDTLEAAVNEEQPNDPTRS